MCESYSWLAIVINAFPFYNVCIVGFNVDYTTSSHWLSVKVDARSVNTHLHKT